MELAGATGPMPGLNPKNMEGLVIDDTSAKIEGEWGSGAGLTGFVGYGYLYSSKKNASVTFRFKAPADGKHEIRVAYANHENRGSTVPVSVSVSGTLTTQQINMKKPAPLKNGFISLGTFDLKQDEQGYVQIRAEGAGGNAHADAIQIVAVK